MPFKSGQFSCHVPQHPGRTPAFHRKCNIVVHILKTKYSIYMNVKYESESTKPLCKVLMRKRQAAACLNGVDISPYRGKDHAASSARRSVQSHIYSCKESRGNRGLGKYRFAFDLGTTSVGWAVFELDGGGQASQLRLGVLVYVSSRMGATRRARNQMQRGDNCRGRSAEGRIAN